MNYSFCIWFSHSAVARAFAPRTRGGGLSEEGSVQIGPDQDPISSSPPALRTTIGHIVGHAVGWVDHDHNPARVSSLLHSTGSK
jgi:hypothetical protein